MQAVANIFRIPELRKKMLVTAAFLVLYRLGSIVPIPGIDVEKLNAGASGGGLADIMQMMSMLTGGALAQCTIFALGIMPYISASIIFSLLVKVIPALEALQKEGDVIASLYAEVGQLRRQPVCLPVQFAVSDGVTLVLHGNCLRLERRKMLKRLMHRGVRHRHLRPLAKLRKQHLVQQRQIAQRLLVKDKPPLRPALALGFTWLDVCWEWAVT